MSSVSAFQIKVNKEEYNQKKREAAKVIDNMYKLLLERAEEIREEKRRKNVIREIEKAREDLWSMLSENTPYYYTEMKIHLRKDPFIRIFHGAEYYIKEILNLIEKEKAFVEEKRKDIEKILKKIETIKEGKTIFSKDVLQKISHFDKSLIEKDIDKAEKEIKKIIPFLEKALREEKGLKKLEEIISSLKTEEKTEKNPLSLLEEEKKLKENREKELKNRSLAIKMLIEALSAELPQPFKSEAEKIIEKPVLSVQDLSDFLVKYSDWKEKQTIQKLETKLKEKIKIKLEERGYTLISDGVFMLFSKKEGYKVAIKINNGKITSKFIREIDHQPSEYDRIKDKEELKIWCKDQEDILNQISKDGIIVSQITNIPDLLDINYEIKEKTVEHKKQLAKED